MALTITKGTTFIIALHLHTLIWSCAPKVAYAVDVSSVHPTPSAQIKMVMVSTSSPLPPQSTSFDLPLSPWLMMDEYQPPVELRSWRDNQITTFHAYTLDIESGTLILLSCVSFFLLVVLIVCERLSPRLDLRKQVHMASDLLLYGTDEATCAEHAIALWLPPSKLERMQKRQLMNSRFRKALRRFGYGPGELGGRKQYGIVEKVKQFIPFQKSFSNNYSVRCYKPDEMKRRLRHMFRALLPATVHEDEIAVESSFGTHLPEVYLHMEDHNRELRFARERAQQKEDALHARLLDEAVVETAEVNDDCQNYTAEKLWMYVGKGLRTATGCCSCLQCNADAKANKWLVRRVNNVKLEHRHRHQVGNGTGVHMQASPTSIIMQQQIKMMTMKNNARVLHAQDDITEVVVDGGQDPTRPKSLLRSFGPTAKETYSISIDLGGGLNGKHGLDRSIDLTTKRRTGPSLVTYGEPHSYPTAHWQHGRARRQSEEDSRNGQAAAPTNATIQSYPIRSGMDKYHRNGHSLDEVQMQGLRSVPTAHDMDAVPQYGSVAIPINSLILLYQGRFVFSLPSSLSSPSIAFLRSSASKPCINPSRFLTFFIDTPSAIPSPPSSSSSFPRPPRPSSSSSSSSAMAFTQPAFAFSVSGPARSLSSLSSTLQSSCLSSSYKYYQVAVNKRCGFSSSPSSSILSRKTAKCLGESVDRGQQHDDAISKPYSLLGDEPLSSDSVSAFELDGDATLALDDGGPASGSGSNSNDGGGRYNNNEGSGKSESDDDMNRSSILSKYGKTEVDLPEDVRTLTGASLDAYLSATRGFSGLLASIWSGWRRRVAADPEFPFKLLMEQTVGLGLTVSGMVAARGREILNELDFAICDTVVGATMNFTLVYLLTPTIGAKLGMFSQLPANLFARGNFTMGMRIGGFLHKSALFCVCGFAASVVGTSLSQGLLLLRRNAAAKNNPDQQKPHPELPNIWVNSLAWGGFMFLLASPRYQVVAGVERGLFEYAPGPLAKLCSGLLRTGNNVLGGAVWVMWAKAIGLQKTEKNGESDIVEQAESLLPISSPPVKQQPGQTEKN